MQFNILLISLTALASVSSACKCLHSKGIGKGTTKWCCQDLGGTFQYGEDCKASTISNKLSSFDSCCRTKQMWSDCRYPGS